MVYFLKTQNLRYISVCTINQFTTATHNCQGFLGILLKIFDKICVTAYITGDYRQGKLFVFWGFRDLNRASVVF